MDVFTPKDVKQLTLLCVSDTHESYEGIARVMSIATDLNIDYIIHSGDWTNISLEEQHDALKLAEAEAKVASQLSQLEALVKPVLYIPGNHDPKSLFKHLNPETVSLSPYSKLLSEEELTLAPGLAIQGFGGAPPGYCGTEKAFNGFPYEDEESYDRQFGEVMTRKPNSDMQYILVTHCGPAFSPTSTIHTSISATRSSSPALNTLLLNEVSLT